MKQEPISSHVPHRGGQGGISPLQAGEDVKYAWCFSHGRMHFFRSTTEHPDGAWCTALWVKLNGDTEEGAIADKETRFADARFAHELGPEQHVEVYEAHAARDPRIGGGHG